MEIPFLDNTSRRVFVKGIGFVSLALVMGTMGGCEKLAETIRNRPMRRRLRTGSAAVDADIATYQQAVTLMKALPSTDQRSWTNQAAIHGVPAHFNFCQHGTSHFFDWHRGYLFYLEKICQRLTGNPKFGLPYWNWNQDPGIHAAFLDVNSPLFLARNQTTMAGSSSISTGDLDPIFADTNFFTFGTQIEGTPHNTVHGHIGGTMGGGGSAADPIFWMHHCMVDYCWAKWNIELGNHNTNDSTWVHTPNTHFVDADGNPATIDAGVTTILPLISYQYESSAIGSSPATAPATTKSAYQKLERRIKAGANIRFEIKKTLPIAERASLAIAKPFSQDTKASASEFAAIINSDATKERMFVSIEYAKLPPTSDFFVRVFVNLPGANSGTPTEDPHYAGSFAFFGTQPADEPPGEHHHPPKFLVNLTNTLQKLKRTQQLRDSTPISVQLVTVPFTGKFEREDTELVVDKIEIIVTPVINNDNPP